MAFEWFRSWHGAPTDNKFLLIAKRAQVAPGMVSAVYWALLDYASQNDPRGSVEGFDIETYAEWAGWEERDVIAVIAALTAKKAIIDGCIAAWEKRQPKREDPGAADRMRKMRDAQRNAVVTSDTSVTSDSVTDGYAVLHDVTPSYSRSDQIRSDQKRSGDEGLQRPPASSPPPSQEPADPEYGAALSKLESLGMMTGTALLELQALWPDLRNGRRAWIDDAITVAHANKASSPVYAIRVLANAVKTGNRPGQAPERSSGRKSNGVTKADMDAIFGVDIHGNPV